MRTEQPGASKVFKKIIVNNGHGKRVQVVGWDQEQKRKLMAIEKDGMVRINTK